MNNIVNFFEKYSKVIAALIVCLGLCGIGGYVYLNSMTDDAVSEVEKQEFEEKNEDDAAAAVIDEYYKEYAKGDTDALEKVASPISDKEKSYIEMISKHIESYDVEKIYTKEGVNDGDLMVSVVEKTKYKDLKTEAPSLDFFYMQRDTDGNYTINNLYSNFNTTFGETEVDKSITKAINAYETQDDFDEIRSEVQNEFDSLKESDEKFAKFFDTTIVDAVNSWSVKYEKSAKKAEEKKAEEEKKKEEAVAKKAEEEKKKEEETEKKEESAKTNKEESKEETEETKGKVTTKDTVNVRSKADKSSESLGKVKKGVELTSLGTEGDWTKVEFRGKTGYIKSEFVKVKKTKSTQKSDSKEEEAKKSDSKKEKTAKEENTEKKTVYTKDTVNIRKKADKNSKSLGKLKKGVKLTSTGTKGDWTKVEYDGGTGYIKSEYLTTKKPKEEKTSSVREGSEIVLSSSVNMREKRSENSDRIKLLYKGSKVKVTAVYDDGWAKISCDGKTGYAKSEFLK